ncbi:hypothetical protein PHLGIDRAFT_116321 [Phlebiopsis gigantea 11061_1 CR5-6]|uniref:Uncharacterized protein n=1 Tax=Phlebiopsis gigantea (strain 11061_1 CR5-6) TaxID=745531 RepID=A0A0C3SAT9_PHLG1|nr:hypothetical protein PHLGIDRAFT_116321 [Phlebiopsis gigantea 11061_1 CR5-6]
MDSAADACSALALRLANVDPPASPASPATRQEWDALAQSTLDVVPHIRRLFGQAVLDPPPAARRRGKAQIVNKRIAHALEGLDLDPLDIDSAEALFTCVSDAPRAKREDAALRVLCRGFEPHLLLRPYAKAPPSILEMRLTSRELADVADVVARLARRHTLLTSAATADLGHSWAARVVHNVEALKFALDWRTISGPGSQVHKSRFYSHAFAATIAPQIPRGDDPRVYIAVYKKQEYQLWKRDTVEPLVTARNRLLLLYNTFGAGVLCDPVWNLQDLASHASRDLPAVLIGLSECRAVAEDLLVRHQNGVHTLLVALDELAGSRVRLFVHQFLTDNPPVGLSFSSTM